MSLLLFRRVFSNLTRNVNFAQTTLSGYFSVNSHSSSISSRCDRRSYSTDKPKSPVGHSSIPLNVRRAMEVPEERKMVVELFDENGQSLGVMKKSDARGIAFDRELQLLEESEKRTLEFKENNDDNSEDPKSVAIEICRLVDATTFRQKSRENKQKKKIERETKEAGEHFISLNSSIDKDHFAYKIKQIISWLNKRYTVNIQLSMVKVDVGNIDADEKLNKLKSQILEAIEGVGIINANKTKGSNTHIVVSPKLSKNDQKSS